MPETPPAPLAFAHGFAPAEALSAGNWVAFQTGGALFVARPDGRNRRQVFADGARSLPGPPVWSRDGAILFHCHDQIWAIDAASGQARAVSRFAAEEQGSARRILSVSPDSRALFFLQCVEPRGSGDSAAAFGQNRLCALDMDSGRVRAALTDPPGERLRDGDVCWESRTVVASVPGPGWVNFFVADLDGGERRLLCQAPGGAGTPRLSPDGRALVCDAPDGLHLVSLADGEHRLLAPRGRSPAWSPDGQSLAFLRGDSELWRLALADGRPEKLAWFPRRRSASAPCDREAAPPTWSPDGQRLWFHLFDPRPPRGAPACRQGVLDFAAQTAWLGDGDFSDEAGTYPRSFRATLSC